MIDKLTKEQEEQIPKYIDKWVSMACKPMEHKKAKQAVYDLYGKMGEVQPLIITGASPQQTYLLCAFFFVVFANKENKLRSQLSSQLHSQLHSQLRSQLYSQLRSQLDSQLYSQLSLQLYSQLRSQLHSQLRSQLDSQLRSQLDSQLRSQLRSQLDSQLDSQLRSQLDFQLDSQLRSQLRSQLSFQLDSQLRSQLDSQLRSQLDSQLDSQLRSQLRSQLDSQLSNWYLTIWWLVWCAWYDYAKYIGVRFDKDKYKLFVNFISQIQFIIPYKQITFISEKPIEIYWKNRRLHNDNGASVLYKDGYSMWNLNGVTVTQEIVETPADKLDPKILLKENNAEVRREIIRKIGMDRVLQKLQGEKLSSYREYELYNIDKIDIEPVHLLKMKCPSVDLIYTLRVPPNINTAQQAINWVNWNEEKFLVET